MSKSQANVLFIYPSSRTQSHRGCPMGLQMLAAVVEQAGYQVHLLDANAAQRRRSTIEIVAEVNAIRPDVVGITLVTPLAKEAYRLAQSLKEQGFRLIAGGPHATLLPEEPLAHGFDAVVVGEGEPTIVEAIDAVLGRVPKESVPGLVYRLPDGQIRHNELRNLVTDLDTLPLPARHLVDPLHYSPTPDDGLHSNLFSSRGCTARCSYCAGGLFGKKFRFRSAQSVLDEMLTVHHRYGTRHFHFVDDAMTMNRDRVRQICDRLREDRLGLTWSMMTRIDSVDEELLELASQAGCVRIDYGVESGNPETLKAIHKPHSVEMVRRVIALTHRYGIQPVVFFILGFPWEDPAAMEPTFQLMRDIAPYVAFHPAVASILIPFPGTEIYDRYKDRYGFANWWLSADRTYDAPQPDTHPYYQSVAYWAGTVLDADFFHYSPELRSRIHDVFRFMYAHSLRDKLCWVRAARLMAFDLSRKLYSLSPKIERAVFKAPARIRKGIHIPRMSKDRRSSSTCLPHPG